MRKIVVMAFALCFMLSGVALAEPKIGVVDMQKIATQSDPAKDAQKRMEKKFGAERAQLEKQTKALQKQAEGLKGSSVTEEKKVDFIRKKRELDEKARNFARRVEQDNIQIRQEMVAIIYRASYEVAQRKNFDFIVDIAAGGVLYAQQSMDLTADVLAEANRLWKTGEWKKKK